MAGARKGRPYGYNVNFTDTMCPTSHPSFALQNPPSPKGEGFFESCDGFLYARGGIKVKSYLFYTIWHTITLPE